jgi:hypothetical protein
MLPLSTATMAPGPASEKVTGAVAVGTAALTNPTSFKSVVIAV